MDEQLAELAACFRREIKLPGQELIRLTAAARADGGRRDGIAAACGIKTSDDLSAVICQVSGGTGAEVLLSATRDAIEQLTGSQRRDPRLTWGCRECGQQVTDRGPGGRPAQVEHGHAPGCGPLARDQAR